jgi:hypothetical protein
LVSFLLRNLSILFPLVSLDPNANGVAVLASVAEVATFRLICRVNVGISAANKNLMKPFSILSEMSK